MSKRSILAFGFAGFALLALSALLGAVIPGWAGLARWLTLLGCLLTSLFFYGYGVAPGAADDPALRFACWACMIAPLVSPLLGVLGLTLGAFAAVRTIFTAVSVLAYAWFFFVLYNGWRGKVRQWALATCAAALGLLVFGPVLSVVFLGDVLAIACYACATMALFCQHAVTR